MNELHSITSVQDEIADTSNGRPHVVILGAGASVAAFPDGEMSGRKLPEMKNLVAAVGLEDLLKEFGRSSNNLNFEALYSDLCEQGRTDLTREIEARVLAYFSPLALPDSPTIYDHLVLSLRPKDVIATFNWDPFLWQTYVRNQPFTRMPATLFLHGNVACGYCAVCQIVGSIGSRCRRCGEPYTRSPLLFPVKKKDYISNPFIKGSWETLTEALEHAFMLTIFGYGAPTTDVEAVNLLRKAWGSPSLRNFEQIEVIDIKHEDDLLEAWKDFIHSHHYRVCNDFYNSWIANHPRRTCEAMWNQTQEVQYLNNNPVPKVTALQTAWKWYSQFLEYELVSEATGKEPR